MAIKELTQEQIETMTLEEKAPYVVSLEPSFNTGRIVYGEDKSIRFKPK